MREIAAVAASLRGSTAVRDHSSRIAFLSKVAQLGRSPIVSREVTRAFILICAAAIVRDRVLPRTTPGFEQAEQDSAATLAFRKI